MIHPIPGAPISQRFAENPAAYAPYGLKGHEGLDFAAPVGTPVHAAHDGAVVIVRGSATYGNYVTLWADHVETIYAHLSAFGAVGPVRAGDVIGYSGNTGRTTGPHLHWAVRPLPADMENGFKGWVDPEPYLQEGDGMSQEERERIVAARWNAEQAVRQIEQTMLSLQEARRRLVEETIPRLYAAEAQGQ